MEIEYIKCRHEKELLYGCKECDAEKIALYSNISSAIKKDTRIPILRGCPNLSQGSGGQCFCTGTCKEIVGYREPTLIESMTTGQWRRH